MSELYPKLAMYNDMAKELRDLRKNCDDLKERITRVSSARKRGFDGTQLLEANDWSIYKDDRDRFREIATIHAPSILRQIELELELELHKTRLQIATKDRIIRTALRGGDLA